MSINGTSAWLSGIAKRKHDPLTGSHKGEVAIVGGGLTGLSTAYYLKKEKPDWDVIVVEAGVVGSGASGASTGMLGPGVGGSIINLRDRFGDLCAQKMYAASVAAVESVVSLIHHENLSCELELSEQILVARTKSQGRSLLEQSKSFRELGFDVPYIDRNQFKQRLPGDYYGGVAFKQAGLVNPAMLCQELARLAIERGVKIFQNSPVKAIQPGAPTVLELENGTVRAQQIVVATNAFTAQLGLLKGRVTPLYTHVLLTDVLSPQQLAELPWEGREAIVEFRNLFNYFRLTPDNRILFGGGKPSLATAKHTKGVSERVHGKAIERVERDFRKVFPSLSELCVANTWSGPMGFTLDRLPILGSLGSEGTLHFAGAWCGHGLALATASGAVIAKQLIGDGEKSLPWFRSKAPWLPPDPLRRVGISMYLGLLEMSDRFTEWGEKSTSTKLETVKQ
ncbi:MAG: FAD-binding oxidoreductase [Planctomycetota bacterium]|nr:FAD-binding oxidoreductase [Planctomycetota bacterium]